MRLETALEKQTGRTITQLVSATGMSKGGVIQALRRHKSKIKVVGEKREHPRGPAAKLYALKKGQTFSTNRRSRKTADAVKVNDTLIEQLADQVAEVAPGIASAAEPVNALTEVTPDALEKSAQELALEADLKQLEEAGEAVAAPEEAKAEVVVIGAVEGGPV